MDNNSEGQQKQNQVLDLYRFQPEAQPLHRIRPFPWTIRSDLVSRVSKCAKPGRPADGYSL